MKYRTLDYNGDYTLGKNMFLKDREAVGQAIKTVLLLLLGEWWENTYIGTPWFERVLGVYGINDEKRNGIDLVISNRILETKDVTRITRFKSEFNNRSYSAAISVDTVYGGIDVNIKSDNGVNSMEVSV